MACVALVALLALWGLWRGLLRQIFGLLGFAGGIVLARLFARPFGDAFAKDLGLPPSIAAAALGLGIFLAAELVAKLLGGLLHEGLKGGFTGALDRGGGFVAGAAKGVLAAWALASLVVLVRPHLGRVEKDTALARLDLAHSRAVSLSRQVNLISELRSGGARAAR